MRIPYSRQEVTAEDIEAIVAVLKSDFLTQGPQIEAFERAFAQRHEVSHAVAVSSATGGLHVACLALGVGPGSRVWTCPISFLASANCARYCGAQVDFVDIDPRSRNMSVADLASRLERARATKTLPDVVIPVDFSGLPCDLREIRDLADKYGFKVLEDASHGTGAEYAGQPLGHAYADATVFSFHAVKIITAAEGGIVTTQDDAVAQRLRLFRSHGMTRDPGMMEGTPDGAWYYEQQVLGFNYRLTDIQAALGLSQLRRLADMQRRRLELVARYDQLLAGLPVILPPRGQDRKSAWHLYVIEIDRERSPVPRKQVFEHMSAAGIGVNVHYIPIHTQPYYRRLGFARGDFPASERYYEQALSIPLFPALTDEQQRKVVATLRAALGH